MPMDPSRYPDNWPEIAQAVKEAANWTCQECGAGHMEDGTMGTCLTVHHPDCDPENEPYARKQALCARCHLRADRQIRLRKKTKDQIPLFEEEPDGIMRVEPDTAETSPKPAETN